jgi:flagellar biosynthesis protein FliR
MSLYFVQDWTVLLRIVTVFFRLGGLFVFAPFFSHHTIPARIRLLLAIALTFALYPLVSQFIAPLPAGTGALALAVLRESLIGILLGFVAYLTFEAIHLAAQFVGYQMGFGSASVLDPMHSQEVSVLVPLQGWLALMIFLMADLHHQTIAVFVRSYETTAELHAAFGTSLPTLNLIVDKAGHLFVLAIQLAAPFSLVILACNVLMGVLARLLPQMNILLFSFPITILFGMAALYVVAPELLDFLEESLGGMSADMMELLRVL